MPGTMPDIIAFFLVILVLLKTIPDTLQQSVVKRDFSVVRNVDIGANTNSLTVVQTNVTSRLRCSSICVERKCACVSFSFDQSSGTCHMYGGALTDTGGTAVGYNKNTECAVPRVIQNTDLQEYTGCTARYACAFGYDPATSDPSTVTCKSTETWAPNGFSCSLRPSYLDLNLSYDNNGHLSTKKYDKRDDFNFAIVNFPFFSSDIPGSPAYGVYMSQLFRYSTACGPPPTLDNGAAATTTLAVGNFANYSCDTDYINRGGIITRLTCLLGGTWSGVTDMNCMPINADYTITIVTSTDEAAGTDAEVYVTVYGTYGDVTITFLDSENFSFEEGDTESKSGTYFDVGTVTKIKVGHDDTGIGPGWKPQTIDVQKGSVTYSFSTDEEIADDPFYIYLSV